MVRLLKRVGFRVLEASSGNAALEAARSEPEPIDVLVTDISLPDMNGVDLAKDIQSFLPGIRTLFVSGRGDIDLGGERGAFLSKPFAIDELMGAVKKLLDEPGAQAPSAGEQKDV
jgi:DNA-binding response OmpR family regulator